MRVSTNASTFGRRATVVAASAIIASALIAAPASADSDDIVVTKTANVASAGAGDTVTYTVEVRGVTSTYFGGGDTSVTISDTLPGHMTYVPGSSTVTFNDAQLGFSTDAINNDYSNGSGWTGPWVEANDDGSHLTGDVLIANTFAGPRLRIKDTGADNPSLTREVALPGTLRAVLVTFGGFGASVEADDEMEIQLSFDGGATWPVSEAYDGDAGILGAFAGSVSTGGLSASSLHIRVQVTSGTSASNEYFSLNNFVVTYVADTSSTTFTDVGDPSGPLTEGPWDLGYGDTLTLTYEAVVDSVIADETIADPTVPTVTTEVTNNVLVTSVDDPAGEAASLILPLVRDPDFDIALSHNGPLQLGQPLTITAVVSHSDASDGFPLCGAVFQANVPDYEFTLLGGDDGDGCLEYSEEWTFAHTIPNMAAAVGLFNVEVGLFGEGPAQDTFESVHELEYTVVLADTGAANTGVLVTSLAFLVSGAAVLFLAAQRRRLV